MSWSTSVTNNYTSVLYCMYCTVLYCTVLYVCTVTVLYYVTVCKCTSLNQRPSFFSYDGVYASDLERVDGGGSLELVAMVEEELAVEQGSLSGTWDFAHQLQIIWKNALGIIQPWRT